MKPITSKKLDLVEKLLAHDYDVNEEFGSEDENKPDFIYIDLLWKEYSKHQQFDVKSKCNKMILILLQADSKFPKGFDYEKSSQEVKHFVNDRRDLHSLIERKEDLENKLQSMPRKLSYYFNEDNQSLLFNAIISGIDSKNFWYYREKCGLKLALNEVKNKEIRSFLTKAQQEKVKNSKELPGNHLSVLNSISKISDNNPPNENYRKYIEDAYNIINENPGCSKVLMVAAASKNLQIIFDFNYNTTQYLDPLTSEHARGKTSSDGVIKIGAKGLLSGEQNKSEVLATIIHELCHFAILMTFMNNFNPYKIGESDEKIRFKNKVYKECKNVKKHEKVIQLVFDNYKVNSHDLELIVRPYHIMMYYYNNPDRIAKCEKNYPELFAYVKDVVELEFDNVLIILKTLQDGNQTAKFCELTEPFKAKILHTKIDFQGQKIAIAEIIENDQNILQHLTSDVIKSILVNKKDFQLGDVWEKNAKYEYVERKFVYFESEYKEKIFSHDELVSIGKGSKFLILTGKAGDGKTRTFEELTKIFKNISKNFWVSYIKLRNYRDIFEETLLGKNISIEILIELFCQICKTSSKFETEVFKKLFSNGKVILFLDGVDEICPKFNEFIIEIVKVLKDETKIQVWISTRPHHVTQLEKIAEVKAFTFEPYGKIEATKLMKEILKSQKKLPNHNIINELFEFFNKVIKYKNPLLIIMITELFVQTEFDLNSELKNIYEVYEKLINEQVSRKEIDNKDRLFLDDFLKMLKVLALKFMFEPEQINFFSIIKKWENEKKNWTAEKIQRFGFVIVELDFFETDNKNSIDFIHYSYAEYFVTQFILDYIFEEEKSDEIIIHIFDMIKSFEYKWDSNSMLIGNLKSRNKFSSKELHAKIKDLVVKEIHYKFEISIYSLNSEFLDFWIPFTLKDQQIMKKVWKVGHEKPLLKELIFSKKGNRIRSILEFVNSCFEENWDEILTERQITINENQNYDKNIEKNKNELFFKNLYKLLILVETKFNNDEVKLFRKTIADELEFFIYELEGDYFMKCLKKVIEIYKTDQEILLIILNLIIDNIVNIKNLNNFQDILEFFYENDHEQIQNFLLRTDVIQKFNFTLGSKIYNSRNEIYFYKLEYLTKLYGSQNIFTFFIAGSNLFEIFNKMSDELILKFTNFTKNAVEKNENTFCDLLKTCNFRYEAKPLLRLEAFLNNIFNNNEEFLRKGMRNILFYNNGNIHRLDSFSYTADSLENFNKVITILKKYKESDEEFKNVFKSWEALSSIIFKMSDELYPEFLNLVEDLFRADKTELIDLIYPNRYSSKDNNYKLKRFLNKIFNNNYNNVQKCILKMKNL